ncbi:hypothetical protein HSX37_05385|uniref:hypothetical protein n=1 Tax=Dendrosporobacter quercicolus TaxID=146817 RepID=UPI001571166C|nr:hypothetical protein [Dendrosporobacter quercicolus]NSL47474.1 hypothetical protein [Dendrosporobacter quercicolus DSM 1736]
MQNPTAAVGAAFAGQLAQSQTLRLFRSVLTTRSLPVTGGTGATCTSQPRAMTVQAS